MTRESILLLTAVIPALAQQPAYRANDFTEFVGINGAPIKTGIHRGGFLDGAGKTFEPQVFHDLGIRYYRMPLKYALTLPDQPQQVEKVYRETGARAMMLIDHNKSVPEEITGLVKQYLPGSIAEIEGPNEVNNKFEQNLNLKYRNRTDEAAASLFMDDVYKSLKADPATKDIPVIAFTSIFSDYREARPHNSFDFGNVHSYQGYDVPSSSLLMNFTRFNNIYPDGATIKPFVPTECGYNVEADKANGTLTTGSLRSQALNIPMLLTEYFNHGVRRAYLFAIHNADGYGLLESDLKTKRPSYFALKNLLAEIKDADWNPETLKWEGGTDFTPRALMFTMDGAPETVHSLTLQKESGEWLLLIWNEKPNFWQPDKRDIHNDPVPVTLKVTTPLQQTAEILTQNDKGAYDKATAEIKNGNLTVPVPSSVAIVKLKPAQGVKWETTAPAAPSGLSGSATETKVNFSWQAVPDKDLAAYFVFRNDRFLTATTDLSYRDDSAWIRPGLGYRYSVQAVDKAGNMSARSEAVITTLNKRPDFVVTSLGSPGSPSMGNTKSKPPSKTSATEPRRTESRAAWSSRLMGKPSGMAARTGNPSLQARASPLKKLLAKPNPAPISSPPMSMTSTASVGRKTRPTTNPSARSSSEILRWVSSPPLVNPPPTLSILARKAPSTGSPGEWMGRNHLSGKKTARVFFPKSPPSERATATPPTERESASPGMMARPPGRTMAQTPVSGSMESNTVTNSPSRPPRKKSAPSKSSSVASTEPVAGSSRNSPTAQPRNMSPPFPPAKVPWTGLPSPAHSTPSTL